jgi:hypothetical protein
VGGGAGSSVSDRSARRCEQGRGRGCGVRFACMGRAGWVRSCLGGNSFVYFLSRERPPGSCHRFRRASGGWARSCRAAIRSLGTCRIAALGFVRQALVRDSRVRACSGSISFVQCHRGGAAQQPWLWCLWLGYGPGLVGFEHGVEGDEDLAHQNGERELWRFAVAEELPVALLERAAVAGM